METPERTFSNGCKSPRWLTPIVRGLCHKSLRPLTVLSVLSRVGFPIAPANTPEIMSTQEPTTTYSQAGESPRSAMRPPRVLSCVLCQQRKVRCNREFPCFNCTRAGVQCIPANGARQRRRRFPERELLERLRRYEALLRQNNIPFDPLHAPAAESPCQSETPRGSNSPEKTTESTVGMDQLSSEKKTVKCEYSNEAK